MGNTNKPLQTGYTRVFLIAGRARPDHKPEYFSSLKMGGLKQSFGDITKIEVPDPNNYGKFVEVDRIRGAVERATFSLSGRFAAAVKSRLLELSITGCAADVQLHIGTCADPSNFNSFDKAVIVEDSILTGHSTDDLGALESGDAAVVNETADISSREYYEVMPLTFTARANDIVTNQVNDVVIADNVSCGSCATESNGCQRAYAVTNGAGGSPSTPPDVLFTKDGGKTWVAYDITAFSATEHALSVAVVGDYVVAITNTTAPSLAYALQSDFEAGNISPTFTKVTTGFVTLGKCNHMFSVGRKAFVCGNYGYMYYLEDPTAGVTVLDAGAATISNLNFVYALDEDTAVAVGNDGAVIRTYDRYSWDVTATRPVGGGVALTSVMMKNKNEWWVTAGNGTLWYTLNAGKSWTQKTLPGAAPTKLDQIVMSKDSVMYCAGVVSSKGRIYRSFDGGYSWTITPESSSAVITPANEFLRIAACDYDPNILIAAGINIGGTDGIIALGKV